MRTTNVTPAELQQAKALLLRQITLSESSEDAVAGGFVARAVMGLPLDESMRAAQKYYAITADQMRAAFEKWIHPDSVRAGGARAGAEVGGAGSGCSAEMDLRRPGGLRHVLQTREASIGVAEMFQLDAHAIHDR